MEFIIVVVLGFIAFKMGMFRGVISLLKKISSAVAIQKLLEHQERHGFFEGDPHKTANSFIEYIWEYKPDVFNGKFGQRPHKLSTAVYGLAIGVQKLKNENSQDTMPVLIALGNALSEVDANGNFYPFKNIDHALIGDAVEIYTIIGEEMMV